MRTSLVSFAVIAALAGGSSGSAAPALGDKPGKWEYAELHVQRTVNAIRILPAPGVAPAAPAPVNLTIRWATLDEEVTAESWEQLAEKLKAPPAKKDGGPNVHKLRVLNRLGADGWEMAEHTGTDGLTSTANWVFKRRLP
jgi:hypothetical protein